MNSFILSLRGLEKTSEMLLSALTEIEHKEEQFLYVCHYSCINIKITYMLRNNSTQPHYTHTHIYMCVRVCQQVYIFQCYFVQLTCTSWQTSNTICKPVKYRDDIPSVHFLHKFIGLFHSKVFKYFTADFLLLACWYAQNVKISFTNIQIWQENTCTLCHAHVPNTTHITQNVHYSHDLIGCHFHWNIQSYFKMHTSQWHNQSTHHHIQYETSLLTYLLHDAESFLSS